MLSSVRLTLSYYVRVARERESVVLYPFTFSLYMLSSASLVVLDVEHLIGRLHMLEQLFEKCWWVARRSGIVHEDSRG